MVSVHFITRTAAAMFVPNQIRKCVAYVGLRRSANTDEIRWCGTCFFVGVNLIESRFMAVLVTARHCIEYIAKESADGHVYIRINLTDGQSFSEAVPASKWTLHNNESVDVAAMPVGFANNFDHSVIDPKLFLTEDDAKKYQVGIGDEVLIVGLFREHPGRARATPIVRIGNIAALLDEQVWTNKYGRIDATLIECRSIGGLSGSPVFVTLDPYVTFPKGSIITASGIGRGSTLRCIGLIHGHFDSGSSIDITEEDAGLGASINMGIAIVVPVQKIREILNQTPITAAKEEAEKVIRSQANPHTIS